MRVWGSGMLGTRTAGNVRASLRFLLNTGVSRQSAPRHEVQGRDVLVRAAQPPQLHGLVQLRGRRPLERGTVEVVQHLVHRLRRLGCGCGAASPVRGRKIHTELASKHNVLTVTLTVASVNALLQPRNRGREVFLLMQMRVADAGQRTYAQDM